MTGAGTRERLLLQAMRRIRDAAGEHGDAASLARSLCTAAFEVFAADGAVVGRLPQTTPPSLILDHFAVEEHAVEDHAVGGDDAGTAAPVPVDSVRSLIDAIATRRPTKVSDADVPFSSGRALRGPTLVVPLSGAFGTDAAMLVVRAAPFDEHDLTVAAELVAHAEWARSLGDAAQSRRTDVLTDRDRIARDLHDHVIQRVFAVGLGLQSAIGRAPPALGQDLTAYVDDLQEVIHEIRTAIFELHADRPTTTHMQRRIDDAVSSFASARVRTTVDYVGPLVRVAPHLAEHAEAVVRETVSNAVRHGGATDVTVRVTVGRDELEIAVYDDGSGIRAAIDGRGLDNLRQRAEASGGRLFTGDADDGRTLVRWSVPMSG